MIVKGFVNNMEQWMNACDMIITKAGPGTIAEAFICGLPVLLNAFIPCQEEGNIEYVVRNGTGIFSRDPQTIAATVEVRKTSTCVMAISAFAGVAGVAGVLLGTYSFL